MATLNRTSPTSRMFIGIFFETLVFGIVGGNLPDQLMVQEVDSFAIARSLNHRTGHYTFDGNGRLQTYQSQTTANTNAKFFEDEIIQKEIELVDYQRAEYNSLIERWHNSFDELINEIQRAHAITPLSNEEAMQMLADNDEKSLVKLRELLIPRQLAIINELQFRCLFRTFGMKKLLENESLRDALQLSVGECKSLIAAGHNSRKEVVEQALTAHDESLEMLLKPLTEDQKRAFAEKWAHLFAKTRKCSIEELMVFLDPENYSWAVKNTAPIKKLLSRPSFRTGAAGNLIMEPGLKYSNDELNVFRSFWKNKDFSRWLDLTQEEHARINAIVKDSYKSSQVLLNLSVADGEADREPYELRKKKAYAESALIESNAVKELKKMLGVEGWNRVEDFAELINAASAGPVFDLLEGDLSEQIGLTETQKKQLKQSAAKALEHLTGKTHEIEDFVLERMISAVDEKNRTRLKDSFGRPVKNAPANIDLMLMTL